MAADHPPVDVLRTPEAGAQGDPRKRATRRRLRRRHSLGAAHGGLPSRGLRGGRLRALRHGCCSSRDRVHGDGCRADRRRQPRALGLRPRGEQRGSCCDTRRATHRRHRRRRLLAVGFAPLADTTARWSWAHCSVGVGVLFVNTQSTSMMPLRWSLRLGAVTTFEVREADADLDGVAVSPSLGASLLPYFAVQIVVGAIDARAHTAGRRRVRMLGHDLARRDAATTAQGGAAASRSRSR